MHSDRAAEWSQACAEEFASLKEKNVWTVVPLPPGRKVVGSRWVFDVKRDNAGVVTRYKARFVARGFSQIEGIDFFETFASTAKFPSIRILLSYAAHHDLAIQQFDVSNAYLNANLTEEVYIQQPEGFEEGNPGDVCLLRKALYGLKQSGRAWFDEFKGTLVRMGFRPFAADGCVYIRDSDGVIVATWTDDGLVIAKTDDYANSFIDSLSSTYKIRREPLNRFVGLEITRQRANRTIEIRQSRQILDTLERFVMDNCSPLSTPMEANARLIPGDEEVDKRSYQAAVGSIMFLMIGSRPDIAFAISTLSRFNSSPTKAHWNAIKHLLRYLAGTSHLPLILGGKNIDLIGFVDSAFADDPYSGRSTSGYVFMMGGGAVSWASKRQGLVTLSTTEAEYVGATFAAREGIWLASFLSDLGIDALPVLLHGDNTGSISLSHNPALHARTKHIALRFHFIREKITEGIVDFRYISTNSMPADALTKPLARAKHVEFSKAIGLGF